MPEPSGLQAGVVFNDARSLRDGLKTVAEAAGSPDRVAAGQVAFAYSGDARHRADVVLALYETEPVVRAVLDRCEVAFGEIRGASLLDVMFGRAGSDGLLDDPAWAQPAAYALECALAALWSSAGIRPNVVVGTDIGEIAAAQAAGVFSMEEGLRFSAARAADGILGRHGQNAFGST